MDRFLVSSGPDGASAVIVDGLIGVEVEVCKALYGDYPPPEWHQAEWQQYAGLLRDADSWSADDGRPYWSWQDRYEDGYLTVQRISGA